MLNPDLRRPTPQIARIGESRNCERRQRGGSQRRKKQRVLPRNDRGVFPIQTDRPCAQPHDAERGAIGRVRKAPGKIKFYIGAGASSSDVRAESLKPDLRLTE